MLIAKIFTPKQRMTRQFGYALTKDGDSYSVHRFYVENNGLEDGHYDLTLDEAWDLFKEKCDYILSYPTETFDKMDS